MARRTRLMIVTVVAASVLAAASVPVQAQGYGQAVAGQADQVAAGQMAALSPAVSFGQPARLPTADEHAIRATQDDGGRYGFDPVVQHVLVGTALIGGAFALGFAATGSLSTGLAAAGAVVISYAVLP